MSSKLQHFKYLYQKYRTNAATEDEIEEFFSYLRNPENLEILKSEMTQGWLNEEGHNVKSPIKWSDVEFEIRKKKAQEYRRSQLKIQQKYLWASAASFLIIVAVSLAIYFTSATAEYVTYTTGYGQVEKILLDDGTEVTLNANSELKWKTTWVKDEKRRAMLKGEAFFSVVSVIDDRSNEKIGFDVQTSDLTIQVVGTSFNVKSRMAKTDIFLEEGKILLNLNENNKNNQIESKPKLALVEMLPGESVSYSAATKKLDKADNDEYGNVSWMAGTFMYSNKSVREILQSLQDIYGIQFKVEDTSILDRKLTTNLPYSDWSIVESGLELLLQTQLTREGDVIIIREAN